MKKNIIFIFVLGMTPFLGACDDDDDGMDNGNNAASNEAIAQQFLEELQDENANLLTRFSSTPEVILKMNPNATQDPTTFIGEEAVAGYFNTIFDLFSQITLLDTRTTPAADGNSIFAQFNGDFTVDGANTPYRNVYIIRLDFNANGEIDVIEEYLNPVINGEFLGQPLGSCQEVICD